jgi:hypothetical protein
MLTGESAGIGTGGGYGARQETGCADPLEDVIDYQADFVMRRAIPEAHR